MSGDRAPTGGCCLRCGKGTPEIMRTSVSYAVPCIDGRPHQFQRSVPEEPSWRDRRLAKVCGDKKLVLCIRPAGEPGWLYCSDLDNIVDMLIEGEPGDEWDLKWVLMTQAEIDAMPEHGGW